MRGGVQEGTNNASEECSGANSEESEGSVTGEEAMTAGGAE